RDGGGGAVRRRLCGRHRACRRPAVAPPRADGVAARGLLPDRRRRVAGPGAGALMPAMAHGVGRSDQRRQGASVAEPVTAWRIISTTISGAVTKGVWSIFADRVCAPIRRARNSWVAGLIMLSS